MYVIRFPTHFALSLLYCQFPSRRLYSVPLLFEIRFRLLVPTHLHNSRPLKFRFSFFLRLPLPFSVPYSSWFAVNRHQAKQLKVHVAKAYSVTLRYPSYLKAVILYSSSRFSIWLAHSQVLLLSPPILLSTASPTPFVYPYTHPSTLTFIHLDLFQIYPHAAVHVCPSVAPSPLRCRSRICMYTFSFWLPFTRLHFSRTSPHVSTFSRAARILKEETHSRFPPRYAPVSVHERESERVGGDNPCDRERNGKRELRLKRKKKRWEGEWRAERGGTDWKKRKGKRDRLVYVLFLQFIIIVHLSMTRFFHSP